VPVTVGMAVSAVPSLAQPDAASHGRTDEPTAVRGPPAPLDDPSAPATAAGSAAATGGAANGIGGVALSTRAIVIELPEGASVAPASDVDLVAPTTANDAARAPPVS
jgi:hypothetical protein